MEARARGMESGAPKSEAKQAESRRVIQREEWSEVPQAFVTTAIREGAVLYEK